MVSSGVSVNFWMYLFLNLINKKKKKLERKGVFLKRNEVKISKNTDCIITEKLGRAFKHFRYFVNYKLK